MNAPPSIDDGVFSDFVRSTYAPLHRSAVRMCRSETKAKDLVSETYCRLLTRVGDSDISRLNIGYATRTLARLAIDQSRAEAAERRLVDRVERSTVETSAVDPGVQVAGNAHLVWLLEGVPARQQEVFFLRTSGFSMVEVAELLGIATGTAYNYFKCAQARMRQRLAGA